MPELSPGDVRDVTIADDLKRIRLSHRAACLDRVIDALQAEYEVRSRVELPPMGLRLALDEFIQERADLSAVLNETPSRDPEPLRQLIRLRARDQVLS